MTTADSDFLSPEHHHLLVLLRRLTIDHGYEQLVCAPILEPEEVFAPRSWRSSSGSVRRLAERLLSCVGLAHLRVVVDDVRSARPAAGESKIEFPELFFVGVRDRTVTFELHALGDAEDVAGMLAHEVGRAFLAGKPGAHPFRSPAAVDADEDEAVMGSLATIYLGLGVFATNGSHRMRSYSQGVTGYKFGGVEVKVMQAGALSPMDMAFLFAVQLVIRGVDDDERKRQLARLRGQLADLCRDAIKVLSPHVDALRDLLQIPAPDSWPAPSDFELPPFAEEDDDAHVSAREEAARLRRFNAGHRVFRVKHSRAGAYAAIGLGIGSGLAVVAATSGLGAAFLVPGLFIPPVVGGWKGASSRFWVCSEPKCQSRVPVDAEECPRCGGTVSGEIDHPGQRLAAEEELDRLTGERDSD